MRPRRLAPALAAALLLAAVPACSATGTATLCGSQALSVAGGAYVVQNNEWGSAARECVTTGGGAGFTVTSSSMAKSPHGSPGGFPSIYQGCHWGMCTRRSGLPIQVSAIRAGAVTTSLSTIQPGGSSLYNAAYDIWFSRTPASPGQPDGGELMIWLNTRGPIHPAGAEVASDVILGGRGYDVWLGKRGRDVSYRMTTPTTSVTGMDLHPLVADAVSRGYLRESWYLISVEAGFELWRGGTGLAVSSFSVSVARGGG